MVSLVILPIFFCSSSPSRPRSVNAVFAAPSPFEPIKVMCEINGFNVPAIIDTGAEVTVMSTSCAKRCHLLNQIDTKHCCKAVGVGSGSSEIVGGIDKLGLRIGPLNFQSKISVLRNSRCDLLIGLDVLQRFSCEVSLRSRHLKLFVRGDRVLVPFLKNDRKTMEEAASRWPSHPRDSEKVESIHRAMEESEENEDYFSVQDLSVSMEGI